MKKGNLLFQSNRNHSLFKTPLFKPYVYVIIDVIGSIYFTAIALLLLEGNAQTLYLCYLSVHVTLLVFSDYKSRFPLNLPYIPLIYMNYFDYGLIILGFTVPFFVDGCGDFAGNLLIITNIALIPFLAMLDPKP